MSIERVACYIRVSTQEQKLHGISLDAQRDKLKEYADKHKLKIVEWYEDEGISGRKLIKNRPALQRMLNDAQKRLFDRIIFIKLDRFFRSVAEYHECMKIISPVLWTATEEKYDLTTANGRAFVNMKLTIAELEADQTSERIKLVNEYKVKNAQPLSGTTTLNWGYKVGIVDGVKRVVKDPNTKDMVIALIEHMLIYQSKTEACKWLYSEYGIKKTVSQLDRFYKDTKLYGYYRGNPNYCEPYIDKATFDKLQTVLKKNIKHTPTNNVYLFTGLFKCPNCGRTFTYVLNKSNVKSLRCNAGSIYHACSYRHCRSERKYEKVLLNTMDQYINEYIEVTNITNTQALKNNDLINKRIKEIKLEMSNSVKAFIKGRLSEADHDRDYLALENELQELERRLEPQSERDLSVYRDLLNSNWKELYKALTPENKRAFWRKWIKEIKVNEKGDITDILFF